MTEYVLGVDGGNTKTIALVATTEGVIVGSGRGGCADIYAAASPEAAVETVLEAITTALQSASVRRETIAAGCFSLAGADWPEDFDYWRMALRERNFNRAVVVNDAIGALYAGLPAGPGVVVACGTGAATGARGLDGRVWHSSFWQDAQGGHQLAHKGLKAVYRAELGLGPATALTRLALEFFGLSSIEQILHAMTARERELSWPVASFARQVLDAAESGDAVARAIVQAHGAALGDDALAAARRVGIAEHPFTLALTGGVLRHPSPLLREAIVAQVRASSAAVRVVADSFEPVVGALLVAYEHLGLVPGESVLGRLQSSLPPSALFET